MEECNIKSVQFLNSHELPSSRLASGEPDKTIIDDLGFKFEFRRADLDSIRLETESDQTTNRMVNAHAGAKDSFFFSFFNY